MSVFFQTSLMRKLRAVVCYLSWPLLLLLIISALPVRSLAHEFDQPEKHYPRGLEFEVLRNGAPVGKHTVLFFKGSDGDLNVESILDLSVRFLGLPVFQYSYKSEAKWRDGRIAELDARQDDNGGISRVNVRQDGKDLVINGPNGASRVPGILLPTNHWNPNVLLHHKVINTLTGAVSDVRIESTGVQVIKAQGAKVDAFRYFYSGDIETTVWYDTAGRWVKMMFKAEDGSTIEYVCQECGLGD